MSSDAPARGTFSLGLLSKHRNAIYGFCIVWVVLFHADAINEVEFLYSEPGFSWLAEFIGRGNVAVDAFLFLSGVSLFFAFAKKPTLKQFYLKRLKRLVPSVWIIFGVYWLIRYAILKVDILGFLSRMTTLRFWVTGDESIWFVSLIIVLYLLYPLFHRAIFCSKRWTFLRFLGVLVVAYAVVIALRLLVPEWYDNTEIALTRIPVFIMGCYAGKLVYEKKRVSVAWMVVALVCVAAFFIVFDQRLITLKIAKRFFYAVGGVSIAVVLAGFFELCERATKNPNLGLTRFFTWVGGFSLELYLSHIMINQVLRLQDFYVVGDVVQYAVVACLAVLVAWAVKWLLDHIAARRTRPSG